MSIYKYILRPNVTIKGDKSDIRILENYVKQIENSISIFNTLLMNTEKISVSYLENVLQHRD